MCLKGTNGDADACKGVRQMSDSICPDDWVSARHVRARIGARGG